MFKRKRVNFMDEVRRFLKEDVDFFGLVVDVFEGKGIYQLVD